MSWRDEYFDRVRPAVGDALSARRLAVWGLDHGYLAADALARTGLRRQLWLDDGPPAGAFARSLGHGVARHPHRAAALAKVCRDHNTFETDWDLVGRPATLDELRATLSGDDPPDLLLAGADSHAPEVAAAVIGAGIPLVMTFLPAPGACSVHLVWVPGAAPAAQVIQACRDLSTLPGLDTDREENHVEGLEARSLALALARWILLRESDRREDLEWLIVERGHVLVVRGQPGWPWAVRFLPPTRSPQLTRKLAASPPRYRPPLALLRDQRVLVLGLGTASLFCAEAPLLARQLVFMDGKNVSPYNPVRQIYGTRQIGQPKADALVDALRARLDPQGDWDQRAEGDLRWSSTGSFALGAVQLHLTAADPGSEDRFCALLDQVRPTLAIVGMGRTHDDNFLATYELRRRRIRHITPSAFPGLTHFKHIITDGPSGPCYDCLQGHLVVDTGPGPSLSEAQRELFYGGTQPATLAETYPSAHSLLRLALDLALPRGARPPYLASELAAERACFVGANRVERSEDGQWLYGVDRPFAMVTYGLEDLVEGTGADRPCSCGRVNR